MSETWEETKQRLKKEKGLKIYNERKTFFVSDEKVKEPLVVLKLFNIHKRSLPPGIDIIVVYNVTKKESEWWVENILKAKCYQNEDSDSKTLIYYDVIPVDAKPHERSIYHNEEQITIEEFPDFKTPKRIN